MFPINCWRIGGCHFSRQLFFSSSINSKLNYSTTKTSTILTDDKLTGQFYQSSFDSFETMIKDENLYAESCILLEDTTKKLEFISKGLMEQILDSPIDKIYKYCLKSHRYCLIKLNDYSMFFKKNKKNFLHQSFPVNSRVFTILPSQFITDNLEKEPEMIPDLLNNRQSWWKLINSTIQEESDSFIDTLANSVILNELETKLRFFLNNQLSELICDGPFNQLRLSPFGSSVNGFGWNQSDLDLFLSPQSSPRIQDNVYGLNLVSSKTMVGDKLDTQRILNIVTGYLKDFVPGVQNVAPILMARVPIIKFASTSCGLDGDLTFFPDSRDSGIDIAHVLHEFSRLDIRVIKLVVFTKLWAMQQIITRSAPGVWINSFGLMMLVVHFLQIRSPPLLPPISQLNVIYDPYQARTSTKKTNDLTYDETTPFMTLLTEFLHHLATFDFDNYGCNVMDGLVVTKPTSSPLYIENPTHRHLNVCKNITKNELTKLILIANASHSSLCKGNHVSQLLKPFSRKSINVEDFFKED